MVHTVFHPSKSRELCSTVKSTEEYLDPIVELTGGKYDEEGPGRGLSKMLWMSSSVQAYFPTSMLWIHGDIVCLAV
jgi:hypothetical protein